MSDGLRAVCHGGDIYSAPVKYDFSVNTNPLGMPARVAEALRRQVYTGERYPEITYRALREDMVRALGGRLAADNILCGNGASELLMGIFYALSQRARRENKALRLLLPVPSFAGYERAARAADAEILFFRLREEDDFCLTEEFLSFLQTSEGTKTDVLLLAQPNNPTGRLVAPGLLSKIAGICGEKGIFLIIDECFLPLAEDGSLSGYRAGLFDELFADAFSLSGKERASRNRVLLLRALTKTYALPGLRLGYLLGTDEALLRSVRDALPEWNVSAYAECAGREICAMLAEEETGEAGEDAPEYSRENAKGENGTPAALSYQEKALALLRTERAYLSKRLRDMGFHTYPSEANFLLFKSALPLKEALLRDGMLLRDCADFAGLSAGYWRIAVRTREENDALLGVLREAGKAHEPLASLAAWSVSLNEKR